MTKAKISEYDAVASNNTDVNGVNIAENCPPSGMNNMGREIMAALKRFQVGSDGDGVTVGGNLVVSGSSTVNTFTAGPVSATTLNTSGQVVFNDAGADVDFRVEGDTDANLLFVDAGTDRVGIGTSSPSYKVSAVVSSGSDVFFADANAQSFGGYRIRAGASGQQWAFRGGNTTMALSDVTNSTDRLVIDSSGEIFFPGVGTTASAANAFLNSGSSPANQLLRSTSSIRYKTDVETLDPAKSEAILNFRPVWYRSLAEADRKDWSWYGLIAEEVAEIEPRLVHWSYPESEYEEVETEVEQERTVTDEDGNETTETYTETKTERKLKDDAQLAPDGVQYDRLTVLLLDVVKRQDASIKALEARIAALENA